MASITSLARLFTPRDFTRRKLWNSAEVSLSALAPSYLQSCLPLNKSPVPAGSTKMCTKHHPLHCHRSSFSRNKINFELFPPRLQPNLLKTFAALPFPSCVGYYRCAPRAVQWQSLTLLLHFHIHFSQTAEIRFGGCFYEQVSIYCCLNPFSFLCDRTIQKGKQAEVGFQGRSWKRWPQDPWGSITRIPQFIKFRHSASCKTAGFWHNWLTPLHRTQTSLPKVWLINIKRLSLIFPEQQQTS